MDDDFNNMNIATRILRCNGPFAIVMEEYEKKQHINQQNGLDLYVDVIDLNTHRTNSVKLYEGIKGLYFKKNGNHYLSGFTDRILWVPCQVFYILKRETKESSGCGAWDVEYNGYTADCGTTAKGHKFLCHDCEAKQ